MRCHGASEHFPISIHAPRGGSDIVAHVTSPSSSDFNPRSPRGERLRPNILFGLVNPFQSTLPAGGATKYAIIEPTIRLISIHAPRGGSDLSFGSKLPLPLNFNPRSPRGERPRLGTKRNQVKRFQSTLPAGGATISILPANEKRIISIHAPRGGSDNRNIPTTAPHNRFQSTLPAGGATRPGHHIRQGK